MPYASGQFGRRLVAALFGALAVLFALPSSAQIMPGEGTEVGDDPAGAMGGDDETGEFQIPDEFGREDDQSDTSADRQPTAQQVYWAALAGESILDIAFSCDLDLCDNPVTLEKLLDISGLYEGIEFSPRLMRRAENRLAKTGFFNELHFIVERVDGGVELAIEAEGAVLVRRVEFEGVDGPPFESDLRKLLSYRQGQAYRGDQAKADAQLRTLRKEYEEEGYFGTEFEMDVRSVPGEDHLVDLVFRIDKGEELTVCEVGLRGLRSLSYDEARDKLMSSHSLLARRFNLSRPRYSSELMDEGRESLIDHYRQEGFFQARILDQVVRQDDQEGCVTILLEIAEGPQWEIEFDGDLIVSEQKLLDELPFYESGYVDGEEIRRAERAIRQLYETRGHPFARVRGEEIRRDRLDRVVHFDIEAGPRHEVRRIRLHGNDAVSDSELLADIATRPFELFGDGGFLQREQLLNDLERIERAYRERGFLRARAERFELRVLEDGDLQIDIYIDEGEPTRADRVDFRGNRHVAASMLTGEVDITSGDRLSPLQLRADRSRLLQLYASYGYPMADVETTCETMTGEAVPCEEPRMPDACVVSGLEELDELCTEEGGKRRRLSCPRLRSGAECGLRGGVQTDRIRIRHQIAEGPFVRVGNMLLKGNFDTDTSLIYRELPLTTGEPFDVTKILEGQSNLRSLGTFDSVSIEAIGLDAQAREQDETRAALLLSVEESRNRYLDFKFGLEGRDLLDDSRRLLATGETQYHDDNFFGRAQRFRPRLIGAFDAMQATSAGAENIGLSEATGAERIDYLMGAELIYNHPRFLKGATGIDKLSLTVAPFYMLDLVGIDFDDVLREEWGLRVEVRKQLTEIADRLFVSLGLEGKQAALWTPADPTIDGERVFSPRRVTGKLVPELTFDRRDSPLNPSEGYYVQLQPGIVSGATLVQGGENALGDSYLRMMAAASQYVELFDDFVLGHGVTYGHVVPFFGRDRLVTEDERFRLGGAASVRGFPNNSLGPIRNDQPTGGEFMLNYNAEVRYPLLSGINLYGAAFFDAGLLADCFAASADGGARIGCYEDAFGREDSLEGLRTSAGLGLRYLIADQIPLVADYGLVLDRRTGEPYGNLHFNLGYSF